MVLDAALVWHDQVKRSVCTAPSHASCHVSASGQHINMHAAFPSLGLWHITARPSLLGNAMQATCGDYDLNQDGLQPYPCAEGNVVNPANALFSPPSNSW
jgi:hypothetical protein